MWSETSLFLGVDGAQGHSGFYNSDYLWLAFIWPLVHRCNSAF